MAIISRANKNCKPSRKKNRNKGELRLVRIRDEIVYKSLSEISPAPENDKVYKPINPNEPDFKAFVEQVKVNGITDPLIVTIDGFLVSGHRRFAAAKVIGLVKVQVRVAEIYHDDPCFLRLLRDCNRQRHKSLAEVMREEVVSANPEEAYRALREYREQQAEVGVVDTIALNGVKRRAEITAAKKPLLDAIIQVISENRHIGKLSVRQIFYRILNLVPPPLIHASKPDSVYANNIQCYKAVDELTVRARLAGLIPWDAISDTTRPVVTWNVFQEPAPFIRGQLDRFLKGYYRDLMQSQPNHIEIIGEKNTIEGIIRPVANDYVIPYTIGRGYSSLPPRYEMAQRFKTSGKDKLILLSLSDQDPEGEDLGRAFAQSLRDEFGVKDIVPIKVALTGEQVESLNLPPNLTAKKTSSRRKGFVERHGENVFELEALEPATLQQFLRDAIDSVIDVEAYNAEVKREKQDAAYLDTVRRQAHAMLGGLGVTS